MKRLVFVCVLAALFSGTAHAQGFPSKEVRFINGFPAGGTSGHHRPPAGRAVLQAARQVRRGRQQGGRLGHDRRCGDREVGALDGHTILLASMAMMTVLPQMVKTSIDIDKDLTTIGNVASVYDIPGRRPRHALPELAASRRRRKRTPRR